MIIYIILFIICGSIYIYCNKEKYLNYLLSLREEEGSIDIERGYTLF